VKTLHPKIHGGLLARRDLPEHMAALSEHGIETIDMLVVNLYPFEATVAKADCTLEDAIENIDIGGPAMVRSAAKNWRDVVVLTDANQYAEVLNELKTNNAVSDATKFKCSVAAFNRIAQYDAAISNYLSSIDPQTRDVAARAEYPEQHNANMVKVQDLRYGENSHQTAALYRDSTPRLARSSPPNNCKAKNSRTTTSPTPMPRGNASNHLTYPPASSSTRQSMRCSGWCEQLGSLQQSLPNRPDLRVRRHHRVQHRV